MEKTRKLYSVSIIFFLMFVILVPLLCVLGEDSAVVITECVDNPVFDRMLQKAEETVNYEWIPASDISCWNSMPYKGLTYFPKGQVVKGVPYTLFSYELGFDSLLSLDQYKEVAAKNYSVTAYCASVGAQRSGAVWGSCCATFVSDVFGGNYVTPGGNPKYDNCQDVLASKFSQYIKHVSLDEIKPGDALVNTAGSHIIWVSEVTEDEIVYYEQVPPVARRVVLKKAACEENGDLIVINDDGIKRFYSVCARSLELLSTEVTGFFPAPLTCSILGTDDVQIYAEDMETVVGTITPNDICTITSYADNGICTLQFGDITGYAYWKDFVTEGFEYLKQTGNKKMTVYTDNTLKNSCNVINTGTTIYITDKTETSARVLFYTHPDGWQAGWVSLGDAHIPELTVTYYDGVADKVYKKQKVDSGIVGLIGDVPVREGYQFVGWSTDKDSETEEFLPSANMKTEADCILYGKWRLSEDALQLVGPEGNVGSGDNDTIRIAVSLLGIEGPVSGVVTFDTEKLPEGTIVWSEGKTGTGSAAGYQCETSGNGLLFTYELKVTDAVEDGDYTFQVTVVNEKGESVEKSVTVTVKKTVLGDANGDEKVDGKDVVLILNYIAEYDYQTHTSTVEVCPGADANLDETVDGKDTVLLLRYLAEFDYSTGTSTVQLGKQNR